MKHDKKLVVNARFLTKPITGVQRFAIEISRRLRNYLDDVSFVSPKNIVHRELFSELGAKVVGSHTGYLWEQVDLVRYLRKMNSPLLLNLENTAPIWYRYKITTLHDIGFIRYPEFYARSFSTFYRLFTPFVVKTSIKIITVSEFSKNEIITKYKLPSSKVEVIYNAVNEKFHPLINEKKYKENYILAVSSLNRRKNFEGLLLAFSKLSNENVKLYVVGEENRVFGKGGIKEELRNVPKVRFLGRMDDDRLIELYSNALFFVFPSFYEGFGLPPLEAQACGCPVIVSNRSSLPEIYKDTALYCDPDDVEDIKNKMKMLIERSDLREDLREKGLFNVKRFSWDLSAKKLADVIKEVMKNE